VSRGSPGPVPRPRPHFPTPTFPTPPPPPSPYQFYAPFILSKKGPLGRVWLAAHWDKKLSKQMVTQTSIPQTASEWGSWCSVGRGDPCW
jgi:hypothetical protein